MRQVARHIRGKYDKRAWVKSTAETIIDTFNRKCIACRSNNFYSLFNTEAVGSEKVIEAALTSTRQFVPVKEPMAITTKVPETSNSKIDGIQTTEKELKSGVNALTPASTQDDQFKTARKVEKIAKIMIWTIGIMFPLTFLG